MDLGARALSFFAVGDRYRDAYEIEAVFPFFDGEVAIARSGDQRFLLQHAHLKKQAPSRAIQQYRSLDHPLILPYREVYTEERSLVFIRPYEPYQPLYDAIRQQPASEDELIRWGKSLLQMEAYLRSKPFPMYFIIDPRNIGMTAEGKLIVLYCGLRQITALEPNLDWGTFFHILLTGEMREEPLDKISADVPLSKPMIRLLQKSLRNQSVDSVLSQLEAYERKKKGKGLLDRLFGDKAEGEQPQELPKRIITPTLVSPSWIEVTEQEHKTREASERERLDQERQVREAAERERVERERQARERLRQERLERERQEHEKLAKQFTEYMEAFYKNS